MTLFELCKEIGIMAKSQRLVGYSAAGASLGELNPLNIDSYPVFYIIPSGTHTVMENVTRFDLTLYYIDRLLTDNSNEIDVMSSSIENLKNILRGAEDIPGVVNVDSVYTIRNFMPEKMDDRVCGAYAQVRITVENDTICYIPGEEPTGPVFI